MLMVFMFHRVSRSDDLHYWHQLSEWLETLIKRYTIVAPGEPLQSGINVCLTFDDAYADFYAYLFPWLQQNQCKATVAVPTGMIVAQTDTPMRQRLAIDERQAFEEKQWQRGSFCTWQELKLMADSGLVSVASHGHNHIGAASHTFDQQAEFVQSKQLIKQHCGVEPTTYVYPYGGFDKRQHQVACEHYDYLMRIGGAANRSWSPSGQLLYRVNADPLWQQGIVPSTMQLCQWWVKGWVNQLRGK